MKARKCISDLQRQLLIADSRCGSLKSQLDYMRMVYHHVRPEMEFSSRHSDKFEPARGVVSVEELPPFADRRRMTSISDDEDDIDDVTEFKNEAETHVQGFMQFEEALRQGPRETRKSSNTFSKNPVLLDEKRDSSDSIVPDIQWLVQTPRTYNMIAKPSGSTPRNKDTTPRRSSTGSEQVHSDECAGKFLKSSPREFVDYPVDYETLAREHILSPRREEIDHENCDLLNEFKDLKDLRRIQETIDVDDTPEDKNKVISITVSPRKKATSSKPDDTISLKPRKKKLKLRSHTSKSTIATRDSTLVKRRDNKKRRTTARANRDRHTGATKSGVPNNEIVEIFPNNSSNKGSNSLGANKRNKLDRKSNPSEPPVSNDRKEPRIKAKGENQTNLNVTETKWKINPSDCGLKNQPNSRVASAKDSEQMRKVETQGASINSTQNSNFPRCQHALVQTGYYNNPTYHSYELPTLASNLKRVDRSYYGRYHFRNIPFVVGTSVSPSHNLGLNIQQVLSILKTRQPAGGAAPFLMRKVSKGMEPLSALMERMNDRSNIFYAEKSKPDTVSSSIIRNNSSLINPKFSSIKPSPTLLFSRRNPCPGIEESIDEIDMHSYHEMKNTSSEISQQKTQSSLVTGKCSTSLKSSPSEVSRKNDSLLPNAPVASNSHFQQSTSSISQNSSKGVRDVLVRLHDQFEELNTRYEKLQEKLEKSNDEKLMKEAMELEAELNAKEDEINAVVSLYKEVMALKRDMKFLQRKNSLVCISAEISEKSKLTTNYPGIPLKLNKYYPNKRGNNTYATARDFPASLRLTTLLRQIQTFQKQMQFELI